MGAQFPCVATLATVHGKLQRFARYWQRAAYGLGTKFCSSAIFVVGVSLRLSDETPPDLPGYCWYLKVGIGTAFPAPILSFEAAPFDLGMVSLPRIEFWVVVVLSPYPLESFMFRHRGDVRCAAYKVGTR